MLLAIARTVPAVPAAYLLGTGRPVAPVSKTLAGFLLTISINEGRFASIVSQNRDTVRLSAPNVNNATHRVA